MPKALIIDDDVLLGPTEGYAPDAAKWKRAANFVIDYLLRYGIASGATVAIVAAAASLGDGAASAGIEGFWANYLLGVGISLAYHAAFEYFTGGRTPAKYLTGTRAVRLDGSPLTLNDVLLRSLWRVAPLEPLTFLADGRAGWHDEWTDTRVVDLRAPRVAEPRPY